MHPIAAAIRVIISLNRSYERVFTHRVPLTPRSRCINQILQAYRRCTRLNAFYGFLRLRFATASYEVIGQAAQLQSLNPVNHRRKLAQIVRAVAAGSIPQGDSVPPSPPADATLESQ